MLLKILLSITLILFSYANSFATSDTSGVVFVLDRSGSMKQNDPYYFTAVASNVALDFMELIDPNVKVGVVEFSDQASSLTNNSLVTATYARRALEVTRLKEPSGNTNMMAALRSAIAHLSGVKGPKRIVLLADGLPSGQFNKDDIVDQAKSNGIEIFSLGIALESTGKDLLRSLSESTGGVAKFPDKAADLVDSVRELFSERNQQLWNINSVYESVINDGDGHANFTLPQGMDRLRLTIVFDKYDSYKERDLNISMQGPSINGIDMFHGIRSGNRGSKVAVWTTMITSPGAGEYSVNISVNKGNQSVPSHGGITVFVDTYSDITVAAKLMPDESPGYAGEQEVEVHVDVTDGSGNVLTDAVATASVAGAGGTGGASVSFPSGSTVGVFTTPKEPGTYKLSVQAKVGGSIYPKLIPITFRVFGQGQVELISKTTTIDFDRTTLGVDQDNLSSTITLEYISDIPENSNVRVRKSVPVVAQWIEPIIEPNGESLQDWVNIETEKGKKVRIDGKSIFNIGRGGLGLIVSVQLPEPNDQSFKLIKDGTYRGVIRFSSTESINYIDMDVIINFRKPRVNFEQKTEMISFWWSPTANIKKPLAEVSADYSKESEFWLRLPNSIQVGGAEFARVYLIHNGEVQTPIVEGAKNEYGPYVLSRTKVDFEIEVRPVINDDNFTSAERPNSIIVELVSRYSKETIVKAVEVTTLGASPALLPGINYRLILPVVGPLSLYLSQLISYLLLILLIIRIAYKLRDLSRIGHKRRWRRGITIKAEMPTEISLTEKGSIRTLKIPYRWTPIKSGGNIASLSINADETLAVNILKKGTVGIDGEREPDVMALDEGSTIDIYANKSRRSKSIWRIKYVIGDYDTKNCKFKIVLSPYNPGVIRLFLITAMVITVYLLLIEVVRSAWLEAVVMTINQEILFGMVDSAIAFIYGIIN